MSKEHKEMILEELSGNGDRIRPSINVEQALQDIKDTFESSILTEIPFTEIAALGASFGNAVGKLLTPVGEGIYRCVFPKGVMGTLAMAKDGSGALGAIMGEGGIVGQARWVPVDKVTGPACMEALLIAVAVLAVVKQIKDIKDGQKEIIGILERDKKAQLLTDYDLLSSYMDDYRFYWENEISMSTNLNQVKLMKRNAMKDIHSYVEQIEELIAAKKNILKMQTSSQKIGKILDRFVHYKLALHVFALSQYMEVMLSKNFQEEYLNKVSEEIQQYAFQFRNVYTSCFEKIESLKKEAILTQAVEKVAGVSKTVGKIIAKIPEVRKGPVDEFLIEIGDSICETEKVQIQKTMNFFIQYKESGLVPIVEHIDMINKLSNRPMLMIYDNKIIHLHELKEAV